MILGIQERKKLKDVRIFPKTVGPCNGKKRKSNFHHPRKTQKHLRTSKQNHNVPLFLNSATTKRAKRPVNYDKIKITMCSVISCM